MEEQDMTRLPGEVVESYRQPPPGEVVETYSRPLPGVPRGAARPAPPREAAVRRHSKKGLWAFLGCFALAAALAVTAFLWDGAAPRQTRLDRASLTAQEVYRQVNPAVVVVLTDLGDGSASVGTGVLFTRDGYLLTNYHVVEGGQECTVALDSGRGYEAKYVAGDADSDLAVLKVDGQDLPAAVFGDSDLLTVGDKVYAIGNPLGVELRGTLTDGIVSAIERDVEVEGRTMTLLQTNAALNSGNSGGPLINEYGQVVGINTIKMTSRYSSVEGLGFAIPTAYMERIVNDLLTFGSLQPEPALGVVVIQVGEQVAPDVWGIEVRSVTRNSPADKAGVRAGDYVLSAGGQPVSSSQDLLRVRRQHHLGDELPMTLWRDGEIIEVTLSLMEPAV